MQETTELTPAERGYDVAVVEQKRKLNYPHEVRMISQEELHSVIGSKRYIGGLVNTANGHLHPLNFCIGEARAAEQNGARFFEQSPVLKIHHGDNPKVETENGILHATKVVLAGNAYLGNVESRLIRRSDSSR